MKSLMTKLIYITLIAASLGFGASNALATHDSEKPILWHLDEPGRSRFIAVETGSGGGSEGGQQ